MPISEPLQTSIAVKCLKTYSKQLQFPLFFYHSPRVYYLVWIRFYLIFSTFLPFFFFFFSIYLRLPQWFAIKTGGLFRLVSELCLTFPIRNIWFTYMSSILPHAVARNTKYWTTISLYSKAENNVVKYFLADQIMEINCDSRQEWLKRLPVMS